MKKSLLALAVLGAFAGAASAQSSVSISGSVDAGITGYSDDWKVAGSQSSANQINFAGREDLGGGMSAFFVLTHRFRIQDGKSNTSTGNPGDASNTVFWRNSFVGLASGFGDVRVGRMLMPLQDMNGGFDAFDTGYVGSTHTGGLTATVRANGAIYYRSPNLGGFSFHAAVAPGEGQYLGDTSSSFVGTTAFSVPTAALAAQEQPMGASVRWAAGPFNVGLAYDKNIADYDTVGLYGSWDFGGWKLFGQWENGTINNAAGTQQEDVDIYSISTKIPMGAFVFKAGYVWADSDRSNGDVSKFGLGAEYMLSKRTSLYSNLGKADGDRVTGSQDEVRFDIGFTHKF